MRKTICKKYNNTVQASKLYNSMTKLFPHLDFRLEFSLSIPPIPGIVEVSRISLRHGLWRYCGYTSLYRSWSHSFQREVNINYLEFKYSFASLTHDCNCRSRTATKSREVKTSEKMFRQQQPQQLLSSSAKLSDLNHSQSLPTLILGKKEVKNATLPIDTTSLQMG